MNMKRTYSFVKFIIILLKMFRKTLTDKKPTDTNDMNFYVHIINSKTVSSDMGVTKILTTGVIHHTSSTRKRN